MPFRQRSALLLLIPAGTALLLILLPLIGLITRAAGSDALEVLLKPVVRQAITLSVFTSAISVIVMLLFGMPLAYVYARWRFPFQRLIIALTELPIVLPPAVAGLALLVTFGRRGLIGATLADMGISIPFTTTAVVMAQTFVAVPYFIRSAQLGFQQVPREIEEAARVDGAGGLTLFWRITLPLSLRALTVGVAFGWARALGEFGATILFAGSISGKTQTMPLLVYTILESDLDAALWTSLVLIAAALITLLLIQSLGQRSSDDYTSE
ncbi:MAG: ABC transporter permease [Anaerolineae bacterium]|nr:ABC transporter permease [Anaerolineae bacterium]